MTDMRYRLRTRYMNSHALVIGINEYKEAGPLGYAVSDAEEFKKTLIDVLGFKDENIVLLVDEQATKEAILRNYMRFGDDDIDSDDRLIVFFAGHGHTRDGNRGEVGYLVPYDATMSDYSTLIRWDELTNNSEVIRAKHILFIMDACYGGLAVNRHLQSGSARFLRDMLLRYSRQVLTAGKANQEVADSGGPLPDHSIFTGHLLEGIRGKAWNADGVLTAAALMAYVYGKVANDRKSNQTPHYGQFDGDGDFVLIAPMLNQSVDSGTSDRDTLLIVPYPEEDVHEIGTAEKIRKVKTLLANDASSIALHDEIVEEIRKVLALTDVATFPPMADFNDDELASRVSKYEDIARDLSLCAACIAYWGKPVHDAPFQKIFSRAFDNIEVMSGRNGWLALRYYPMIIEAYCAGIAAIEAGRFDSLARMLYSPVGGSTYKKASELFIDKLIAGAGALRKDTVFNKLPGLEKYHVAMSEHLHKILQPKLDDMLFIGKNYDRAFDEFEVLLALACADIRIQNKENAWGPVGRFGWKAYGGGDNPFSRIIEQGKALKEEWPPIKAGLFGGSYERFEAAAEQYGRLISSLNWH